MTCSVIQVQQCSYNLTEYFLNDTNKCSLLEVIEGLNISDVFLELFFLWKQKT